jgi:hypothetical protein
MRGEALREGDGHTRAPQGALESAREVAMRGEAQRTTLGVTDPDPLDDRGLAADGLVLGGNCRFS